MKKYLPFFNYHLPSHLSILKLFNQKIKWRIENKKMENQKGISLLEVLIVITVFAILGVIVSGSIILSIAGSKKTESIVKVRENISYSMGIIERQLRNADAVVDCPNPDSQVIDYQDQDGNTTSFSCVNVPPASGEDSYVASGSSRLTNSDIIITGCSFSCTPETTTNPPLVTISIEAKDAKALGAQSSQVTSATQIYLRNY